MKDCFSSFHLKFDTFNITGHTWPPDLDTIAMAANFTNHPSDDSITAALLDGLVASLSVVKYTNASIPMY